MKYRMGFVTNSSSSSFLIVGVSSDDLINELALADGQDFSEDFPQDYGVVNGKHLDFYGGYEPCYAGVDAENLMETMTLPQMKQYFKDLMLKEYGVDIPLDSIGVHYGEVGE